MGDSTAGSTAFVSVPGGLKWSNHHSFGSPYIEVGIVYQICFGEGGNCALKTCVKTMLEK